MSLFEMLFGETRTIKHPQFIKDFTKENKQLNDLKELSNKLKSGDKKELIERDISFLKYGLEGEKNVYFELKNSFLPILCLHDIRLEYEDYVAQLDYVVITNKFLCILETKKLNGNITINSDGDFIRIMKNRYGKEIKREGIYSPISQNKRHINIVKQILSKKLNINNMPLKSLVVMANPKTIIDKNKCPNPIKNSLYKYDQIVNYLEKHLKDKENQYDLSEKLMFDIANLLKKMDTPIDFDYHSKYSLQEEDFLISDTTTNNNIDPEPIEMKSAEKDREKIIKELKEYRLITSRKEKVKAYFIFSNAQMDELIEKYPTSEAELLTVKGFGPKKTEKYGKDILEILNGASITA